jgi:hypothetical protein
MPWLETVIEVVVALLGTLAAAFIVRTAWPGRKAPNESWWSAYFRLCWNPGSAVVAAGYLWGVAINLDFAESPGLVYAWAIVWLLILLGVAWGDRRDLRTGARMYW